MTVGFGNVYRSYPQVATVNQGETVRGAKQENLPALLFVPPVNVPIPFPPPPSIILYPSLFYFPEQGFQPPVSANLGPVPFPPPPDVRYPPPPMPQIPPILPVVNPPSPPLLVAPPTLIQYPPQYYAPESNQGYQPLVGPTGPIPYPPKPTLLFNPKQYDYPSQGYQPLPSSNFGPVPFPQQMQWMAFYQQPQVPQQAAVLPVTTSTPPPPPPVTQDVDWIPHFVGPFGLYRGS